MIAITKLKKRATVGKYSSLNLLITPNSVQEKMLLEVPGELSMKDTKKAEKWCINIEISRAWHCISSFCCMKFIIKSIYFLKFSLKVGVHFQH